MSHVVQSRMETLAGTLERVHYRCSVRTDMHIIFKCNLSGQFKVWCLRHMVAHCVAMKPNPALGLLNCFPQFY